MSVFRKLLYSGVMMFLFLFCVEFILRIISFPPKPQQWSLLGLGPDPTLRGSWLPLPGATCQGRNHAFQFNHMGYRGADFDQTPTDGVFRVVCIGDSVAMGYEVDGDSTFCDVLGRTLGRHLQRRVESINAGVVGFSSFQGLHELQTRVLKLHPNLVVLTFAWNDHSPAWTVNPENLPDKEYFGNRLYAIRLYALVRGEMNQLRTRFSANHQNQPVVLRVSVEDYKKNLEQMVQILRTNGIIPVLMTEPCTLNVHTGLKPDIVENEKRQQAYDVAVLEVARSTGELCVDVIPIFEKHQGERLFLDTAHPTRMGHSLIGSELAKKVFSRYLSDVSHKG